LRQLDVLPESSREPAVASIAEQGEAAPEVRMASAVAWPAGVAGRKPPGPGQTAVPDVSGLEARSAIRRLGEASLEPDLRGSGRAVAQSPPPGAIVKRGARVKVTLAPPG
jgi:hypothetical protein